MAIFALTHSEHPMKVLVVCLGNICRSPIAEGLLQKRAEAAGLAWEIDSAGTGSWHVGESPDKRSIQICQEFGLDISHQRARQVNRHDFQYFDVLIAMDDSNYSNLHKLAPEGSDDKIVRMMDFVPDGQDGEVPDPYYDGRFLEVYQLLDRATESFIEKMLDQG